MRTGKSGVLTIFMSLLLVSVLTFLCTVCEAVRITGAKMTAQAAVDSAVDSLFSEYHRQLLESYDLFFISGVYHTGVFSEKTITDRVTDTMWDCMHPNEAHPLLAGADFWRMTQQGCRLLSFATATDASGSAYRRQAAESMKYTVGRELLDKLQSWSENPLDLEEMEQSLKNREKENEQEIARQEEALQQEQEPQEQGTQGESVQKSQEVQNRNLQDQKTQPLQTARRSEPQTPDNPIELIKTIKERGILQLVLPYPESVSEACLPKEGLFSERKRIVGNGKVDNQSTIQKGTEKLLFHEYLMAHFSNVREQKNLALPEGKAIFYETEYLIAGKRSDLENLKTVCHRLLLLRETANFSYLLTDTVKQLEAETLAVAITGLIGIAPLASAVKYGILLAWAYAESIMDVRNLLAGGTVAPIKTAENWQLALENIGTLMDTPSNAPRKEEHGLDYDDYLRILLFTQSEKTLTDRSLDLLEQNMRRQPGNEGFLADAMLVEVKLQATFQIQPLFAAFAFLNHSLGMYDISLEGAGGY